MGSEVALKSLFLMYTSRCILTIFLMIGSGEIAFPVSVVSEFARDPEAVSWDRFKLTPIIH